MIDLHMHTSYSDGTDTLEELLINSKKANLNVISITDHNSCLAYYEMKEKNLANIYDGKIIVGCEFTTSFDNQLIEVLGYGIDYKKIQAFMDEYYTKDFENKVSFKIYNRLLKRVLDLGLKCDIENIELNKDFLERSIAIELFKYPENKEILKEDIWDNFSDFYRKGLTNPNSELFLNYPEFKPSLSYIIDIIHKSGGKAFLAHPYQYKVNEMDKFLNKIYDENDLDGIECFYTTFSEKQIGHLINFAKSRNLLISGGSDYHGTNKEKHDLGIGRGNLNISEDIISNWNINYFN